jgi:cytochrome c5
MFKTLLLLFPVTFLVFAPLPFSQGSQEPAPAPAVSAVKNPIKPTAESQAHAKKVYGYDCEMCHGATGDGKTDLAKDMGTALTDWTDPAVLAAKSDGDLFDLIKNGKGKMPGEDGSRVKPDDVWNLVVYIRGLAKGHGATTTAKAGK